MQKFLKILPLALLVLFVSACSSVKLGDENSVATVNTGGLTSYDPVNDPKSSVYGKRSIYFEFDSYTVDPKYVSTISAHAAYC